VKEVIPTFLDFEKSILESGIKEDGWLIWPIIRTAVFEEIINEVNKKKGLAGNTHKNRPSKSKIFSRLALLINEFASFVNFFRKADILVISNESMVFTIDGKKTNKLIFAIKNALGNSVNMLVFNTQVSEIEELDLPVVRLSLLLSLLGRLLEYVKKTKTLKKSLEFIDKTTSNYYGVHLDQNFLILNSYFRQLAFINVVKFFLKFRTPKLIIFSDHGSMNAINKLAKDMKIKTIDYQHAITTSFHIVYTHGKSSSEEYRSYLTKYLFAWGEYSAERQKGIYDCKVVGNSHFEKSATIYKNMRKENQILIVSDDQLTREYLEELAVFLAHQLPEYKIKYKLRQQEYRTWKSHYPSHRLEISNLIFIDNDTEDLYSHIAKSKYVIGTSSSVLIEAVPFSEVLILECGWSQIMQDYVKEGLINSSVSKEGILELIQNQNIAKKDRGDYLFSPDSANLFRKNIMELLNTS